MGNEGIDDVPVGGRIEASVEPPFGGVRATKMTKEIKDQRLWLAVPEGWRGEVSAFPSSH